jgi:hypothetical protein
MKKKFDNLDIIIKRMRRQHTDWEKIFVRHLSGKVLCSSQYAKNP